MIDRSAEDEQVMTIVGTALKLGVDEREPFLRSVCARNEALLKEALEVLEWETRMGGFLQQPVFAIGNLSEPFAAGDVISERFEVIRKIGEGGMGIVYEAFDRKRKQRIAIKAAKVGCGRLLSPELEGALRVRHPNVCLVNEIHTAQIRGEAVDFLTMELLEGETLSALLLREGELPVEEAREIARQLCLGLKEAHRVGVIHRDLKPGNVIVCRHPSLGLRAVITDFGLSGEASQTGFFGTQRYLAPELLLGQKASKASDIYALGVILHEMATDLMVDSVTGPVRKAFRQPTRSYQALVAGCLSFEPERRQRAFDTAVENLAMRRLSRRQLFGAGIGLACSLAGGGWLEREIVQNWLEPLPRKRFVALLAWPPNLDLQTKSIVSATVNAMENELARAEARDQDLFVTVARDSNADPLQSRWLKKLGDSLGVNLALQVSGMRRGDQFELVLKIWTIPEGKVLRQRKITCKHAEIGTLSVKAIQAAAKLLNVEWDEQRSGGLKPATQSLTALLAFQAAEELRAKPNDDGLLPAIEKYKQALDADARYTTAYARLAIAYCQANYLNPDSGVLELANANASKAVELDPKSAPAHLALAMAFDAKGNFESAEGEIQTASRLDPANPKILPWQALLYRHFHRWREAEQAYRQLQKERPNYWIAYNELGTLLTDMGRYGEAVESFRVAAAAAPGSALAFSNLGALYFKLGKLSEAEENYRRSLTIKRNGFAYADLSETLRVQGRLGEALMACKEAVKLAPSDDTNWLALGDCYESMNGHQREAKEAFRQAANEVERLLQEDQRDGSAWIRLALYQLKTGNSRAWPMIVRKSESGGALDTDSDLLKARVLELAGRREDALALVASCRRRGPVDFQIESVKDLKGLVRDSRYRRLSN